MNVKGSFTQLRKLGETMVINVIFQARKVECLSLTLKTTLDHSPTLTNFVSLERNMKVGQYLKF